MCGLVGIVCKSKFGFSPKQIDVFQELLYVDQLRGEDATGVIYVENDGAFAVLKEASPASWSGDQILKDSLLSDQLRKGKALIGHNRKATVGRVTDETAHPFVVDNTFAMVHNGTLYGHKALKDTEVDSEALAHVLSEVFVENMDVEQLNEKIGAVNGAYAVVAYSQVCDTIFLMRNNQRPLYVMETPDSYIWASEMGMLVWIASRNGYDISKCTPELLKEHTILTIDLGNNEVTRLEFEPKKAMPSVMVTTPTVVSTPKAHAHTGIKGLSKNEFKRIKRRFIGKMHTFFADDWVEKNFPRTVEDGEEDILLMGEFDSEIFAGIKQNVVAEINLTEVFGDDVPEDLCERFYFGEIYDAAYIKGSKSIQFKLTNVKAFKRAESKATVKQITEGKWNATTPALH